MRTSAIKKKVAVKKVTTKVVKKVAKKKASTATAAAAAVSEKPAAQALSPLSKLTSMELREMLGKKVRFHNSNGQEVKT